MPAGVRKACEIKRDDGNDMYDRCFALMESLHGLDIVSSLRPSEVVYSQSG